MDVIEAINSRKSIRAFTDQPVSREIIEELLTVSQRSPSGTNTQPWHVHVCTGEVRQALGAQVPNPARLGNPDEYASLAVEMCKNGYFNGEDVRLDGAIRMAPR